MKQAPVPHPRPVSSASDGQLNRGCTYREQVGPHADGKALIDHLTASRRHSSRDEWAHRIRRGDVEIDGRRAAADTRLRNGQVLAWHRPPWIEPAVPLHFDVIHLDDDVLAVAKPSGLPSMPAGGFLEHTLLSIVRARHPEARPLHRLGRHTSGLTLFARTPEAASRLARAWRTHAVVKEYRGLSRGCIDRDRIEIQTPIGLVPHPRLGLVHAASPEGRPAHSTASVLERRPDGTLVRVGITTGRPHQIRIHLAAIGHPLLGDPLYTDGGVPRDDRPGLPGDGGYLLHAERLQFVHPRSGVPIALVARPPALLLTGRE